MTRTETPPAREREGGRTVLALLLVLALLIGAGWMAAYFAAGDRVPRGATVEGVRIGGRTQQGAEAALRRGLADEASAPFEVIVDSDARSVPPEVVGLSVDYEASVAAAGARRSWSPEWLWDYFTGGDQLDAVVVRDDRAMAAALRRLARRVGVPPREGAVEFRGARVRVVEPRVGQTLDVEHAAEALTAAYLSGEGESPEVELTTVDEPPAIGSRDVTRALNRFANPAVSGPVTVRYGEFAVTLTPDVFTRALYLEQADGRLVLRLRPKELDRLVSARAGGQGTPVDATVRLVDGRPQVVPGRPGTSYDRGDLVKGFLKVVVKPEGKRVLRVDSRPARPDFTTAEARELGIREQVSTFTTYFPYAEYRNVNIGRAAELIDGTVLKPGETFSLNETVGERTRENGFTEGFIISDGIFKEDLGGGVSQMATTTFNAAFFAGMTDVEHKPHSFFIDRYPEGREATVAWGAVDLRFRNDTPYGVLIDTSVTPSTPSTSGVVTVSMWSTKYWDITTSTSARYNFTEPDVRRLDSEDCYPNEGYGGFDVDVTRYFRRAGSSELVRREVMHTTYTPSDTVICTNPAAAGS